MQEERQKEWMAQQTKNFAQMQTEIVEREREKDEERAREREKEKQRVSSLERKVKDTVASSSASVPVGPSAKAVFVAAAADAGAATTTTATAAPRMSKTTFRTKTGHGDPDGGDKSSSSSSDDDADDDDKKPPKIPARKASPGGSRDRTADAVKRKSKEADEIRLQKVPHAGKYRAWRLSAIQAIAAKSGRPAEAVTFLSAVYAADATLESLASCSHDFISLDYKIATAVLQASEGMTDLHLSLLLMAEQAIEKGKLLTGRQALWVVAKDAATAANRGALYAFKDLQAVKLAGLANLGSFLTNFKATLAGCKPPISDDIVQSLLVDELRKLKELEHDIDMYDRDEPNGPSFTTVFLFNAAEGLLERKRHQLNRASIESASPGAAGQIRDDKNKNKGLTPALGAEDKLPKPEKEKKKKSRNRSRSPSSSALAAAVAAALAAKGFGKGGKGDGKGGSKGGTPRGDSPTGKGGKGKGKGKGKGRGKSTLPCFLHQQGNCHYGDACRFTHDAAAAAATNAGAAVDVAAAATDSSSSVFRWQDEERL